MTSKLRYYAAPLILVALALFFNALHFYLEVIVEVKSGTAGYWLNTTAENLQSEAWQVALAAWVFKHYRWLGTPDENEDARNERSALAVPVAVVVLFLLLTAVFT